MKPQRILWLEVTILAAIVFGVYCLSTRTVQSAPPPVPITFVREASYIPIAGAYQKITSLDSVQTLTVPTGARRCAMWIEDDTVRFNDDGTDPDPSTQVGMELSVGQLFSYAGNLDAVELKGSATTIVHVWYYGP
jgi:hypothetical protein